MSVWLLHSGDNNLVGSSAVIPDQILNSKFVYAKTSDAHGVVNYTLQSGRWIFARCGTANVPRTGSSGGSGGGGSGGGGRLPYQLGLLGTGTAPPGAIKGLGRQLTEDERDLLNHSPELIERVAAVHADLTQTHRNELKERGINDPDKQLKNGLGLGGRLMARMGWSALGQSVPAPPSRSQLLHSTIMNECDDYIVVWSRHGMYRLAVADIMKSVLAVGKRYAVLPWLYTSYLSFDGSATASGRNSGSFQGAVIAISHRSVFVLGGTITHPDVSNTIRVFDIPTQKWDQRPYLFPGAKHSVSSVRYVWPGLTLVAVH